MLSTFATTNLQIEGEIVMTAEQEAEMAKWWEDLWHREFMRQCMGYPSEYAESLRAAKAQV